jgi:hypothetical protein
MPARKYLKKMEIIAIHEKLGKHILFSFPREKASDTERGAPESGTHY